jgi:hypothetical protein
MASNFGTLLECVCYILKHSMFIIVAYVKENYPSCNRVFINGLSLCKLLLLYLETEMKCTIDTVIESHVLCDCCCAFC